MFDKNQIKNKEMFETISFVYHLWPRVYIEDPSHGHLLRTAHKLSATKIEHSQWSTGHSTLLWLDDKRLTNS